MNKLTLYIIFIPAFLISQSEIHYPFCDLLHSQSNCRAYVMARAYGGSYCDGNFENIGSPNTIGGAMWETTTYSSSLVGTDGWNIIAWGGENASQHAAYFDRRSYNYLTRQWVISAYHIPNEGGSISFISDIEEIMGKGEITHLIKKVAVWDFKVENVFSGNTNGGKVKIQSMVYSSPKSIDNKHWGSSFSLEAVHDNGNFDGFKWYLEKWTDDTYENLGSEETTSIKLTPSNPGTRQGFFANYKKLWQVTFENEFFGGEVIIEGQQISTPETTEIKEGHSKIVKAINYQNINNIWYYFDEWREGGQTISTNIEYDFLPMSNTSYTAHFTAYPSPVSGFQYDCFIGESIHFIWDQYQNSDVQYQIWRKVKNQHTGQITESIIATLSNSITQYTDEDYTRSRTYNNYLLEYCVRTYYIPEQTIGPLSYQGIFGGYPEFKIVTELIPRSYSILNYPNPFNATTTIRYSLPEKSHVNITVYDFLGRKVKNLVNGSYSSGLRKIIWNGMDQSNNHVSSGMYFYQITANSLVSDNIFSKKLKMILLK